MAGNDWSMRRVSTRTTAPRAPLQMSPHMKPKRSWPGVPNRYMTRLSSTVMRPKSMATVVVVLPPVCVRSSTPADTEVIAASVRSGSISEIEPTKVVLPTPNPPAMTNFTGMMRPAVFVCDACTCPPASDRAHALDHLRQHVELDLHRVGLVDGEQLGRDQIACDHRDHADDEVQLRRHLSHRLRLRAQPQHLLLLRGQVHRQHVDVRLQHRLHAEVAALGPGSTARHDERSD